jgi:hypothetical protein
MARDAGQTHAIQGGRQITVCFIQELGIRLERSQCLHDRASVGCVVLWVAGNHPLPLLSAITCVT